MFNLFEHPVISFSEWVATAVVPAAKKIIPDMKVKALQSKSALGMSQFLKNENLTNGKLGTEQICQIL